MSRLILPKMRTIRRVTTSLVVLLTVASLSAAQDKEAEYDDHMRQAEQMIARRMFENALQTYKKAYALKDKQSIDAALGMALAYRGLGAYKNVVDLTGDAMKLAGDDKNLQAKVLNMRGAALVSLADKPTDKRLTDAEADFRAAIAANPDLHSAQLNLGVTLLKMGHDADGVRELKIYVERAPRGPELENAKRMIVMPFAVNTYPTYIVIDGDGVIRARKSGWGMDTDNWLEDEIKRTLKKK